MVRSILVALAGVLLAAAPLRGGGPPGDPVRAEQQILVMLHLAAPHSRVGSDYGGSYGDDISRGGRRRIALRIAARHRLRLVDNWPMPVIGVDCFIMAVPDSRSPIAAAQEVAAERAVEWTQPVQTFGVQAGQRDPLFAAQPAARRWRLDELHRVATGRGVSVAVIDSKIDASHPDLAGRVTVAADFTVAPSASAESHGTGVAGIVAADAGNGIGIAGVAPRVRLMALRACWQKADTAAGATLCDSLSIAKALNFAIEHKAQVINLSLGGPTDRLLATLLQVALARRMTIVAAFDDAKSDGGFPASLPGIIAVSDRRTIGRNRVAYTAPGQDIPTTMPGGRWGLVDGSSYAAAHVTGLVALMHELGETAPAMLVSDKPHGGEIDACATVMPHGRPCR